VSLLRNSLSGFFSGIGRTRVVLLSAMTAMVVNIAANYILIFGKLGLPALGIRGAAIGTVLGSVAGVAVLLAAYLSPEVRREYAVVRSLRFDRQVMWRLWKFGYPAGLEMMLNVVAFSTVILIFHTQGLATATATTIMFNWDMVSFVPLLGLQVGVTSLVGRYMGAGSPDTAHRAVVSGLKTGWVYSAFVLLLFVFLPHQLVAVFEPQEESAAYTQAVPIAVYMIRLAALYVMIDAVMVVISGALRGAGDTLWAMGLSVSLHWLLVPTLYIALNVLDVSPQVGWTILVFMYLMFSGVFYLRYRCGKWRSIRVVDQDPEIVAARG
jgi:MATE family multidrug resistance protein